jgi:hypothetical protein
VPTIPHNQVTWSNLVTTNKGCPHAPEPMNAMLPPISIGVIASKVTKALVVIVGLIVPNLLLFRVVTATLLFSCPHCYLTLT